MKEAEYYIQNETEGLNKRIDDAFIELNTQRNRISGLTRECNELKQEVLHIQKEQKSTLLWMRILTGTMCGLALLRVILLFIQ